MRRYIVELLLLFVLYYMKLAYMYEIFILCDEQEFSYWVVRIPAKKKNILTLLYIIIMCRGEKEKNIHDNNVHGRCIFDNGYHYYYTQTILYYTACR